jgi:hypothetical protein
MQQHVFIHSPNHPNTTKQMLQVLVTISQLLQKEACGYAKVTLKKE